MSYTLVKPRKAACENCGILMEFAATAEKVGCPECEWVSKFKQKIVQGVISAKEADATLQSQSFLNQRLQAAKGLSPIQKAFMGLQVAMVLWQTSLTKAWLVKATIRIAAAVFGVNGKEALPKIGKIFPFVFPLLLTVCSWGYAYFFIPATHRGFVASLWYASEPAWPGLSSYFADLLSNFIHYLVMWQLYKWLWSSLVGAVRSKLLKIFTLIILPYFILPHVVPAFTAAAIKQIIF